MSSPSILSQAPVYTRSLYNVLPQRPKASAGKERLVGPRINPDGVGSR